MIAFPPAKINIGLHVVRKRADGFHDIETVMLPIPLSDALEAIVDADVPPGQVVYTRSGLPIEGDTSRDLVIRAHGSLGARQVLPGLRMHLHKCIPMGAGLGGGSSDGAHALMLLDRLLLLKTPKQELRAMALSLGSDCPFFMEAGAQLALGRGEVLSAIGLDLSGYWLALVNPGIAVPTAEVYANMSPIGIERGIAQSIATNPLQRWREVAPNMMEDYVFKTRPSVHEACARLIEAGAEHAAMSGSGSTVFGFFRQRPPALEWPSGHSAWVFRLG
ncbi:MAG: 4-(cytidine 5'-diphospho)-2-C-methyl-D-erythritol kinase [Flavobacteriales bacterium]|nr:4-(cytidine 5'-diphospho)-2-C-methyl-D-erythritol kinase [Flavobacteriales bacterium]